MKPILLIIISISLFITSCNNNDDSTTINTVNPSSTLYVEEQPFIPASNSETDYNLTTSFSTANDLNYRAFYLKKNNGDFIHINLNYNTNDVSGTYINELFVNGELYRVATGGIQLGDVYRPFTGGYSMIVTDLGGNKFKLEFINVTAANIGGGASSIDIEGYFTAQFVEISE